MFIHVLITTDHKIANEFNKHTVAARFWNGETNVYVRVGAKCVAPAIQKNENINNSDTNTK